MDDNLRVIGALFVLRVPTCCTRSRPALLTRVLEDIRQNCHHSLHV
jgi:hypothetical protein